MVTSKWHIHYGVTQRHDSWYIVVIQYTECICYIQIWIFISECSVYQPQGERGSFLSCFLYFNCLMTPACRSLKQLISSRKSNWVLRGMRGNKVITSLYCLYLFIGSKGLTLWEDFKHDSQDLWGKDLFSHYYNKQWSKNTSSDF